MHEPGTSTPSPWYHHFWPWFMVILLSTTVVAGLATVWIAVVNRDPLVSDDWYKDGQAINRRLERVETARRHAISATLSFAAESGGIELLLSGRDLELIEFLSLEMSHPTQAERDQTVLLERSGDGAFRGRWEGEVSGRWYATIEPVETFDGERPRLLWRLNQTIRLPASRPIRVTGGSG